ncbi:MAG: Ig-like domain-containing protein [Clostridiales bacterium]|nr:Ig-like domain-containing protein [Clostridiales bacterium]
MKRFWKRLLAALLAVLMLGAIHPVCAYAIEEAQDVSLEEEPFVYTVTVSDQEIVKGESAVLSASFSPYAPEQEYTVEWSSKSPSIVKIDPDGTAHALKRGSAEITYTVLDGNKNVLCSTTCSVKVLPKSANSISEFFEDALWAVFGPMIEPIVNLIGEKVIAPVVTGIFSAIIEGFINGIIDSLSGNKKATF